MKRLIILLFILGMTGVSFSARSQSSVSGTVLNEEGVALRGVSVQVEGSNRGSSSTGNGAFSIAVAEGETLIFRFVGYEEQRLLYQGQSTLQVRMLPQERLLEAVVVTGIGAVLDKRTFTGATTGLQMEEVELGGLADASRALEGRAAGVIVQNTTGTFGTAPKIRVRGATSIYGSSKPLWVIDGLIMDDVGDINTDDLSSGDALTLVSSAIAGLNANDIASFQILKDGSATSIYGARAMGGVIVVTTKRGAAGVQGFSYQSEYTSRAIPSYSTFNIMNSQEQMGVYQFLDQRGLLTMADVAARSESGVYGKLYELISSGAIENSTAAKNAYLREAEYRNTNWFKTLFSNRIMSNQSLSMRMGSDKARYYTSLSATLDPGWTERSDLQRYTFLVNGDFDLLPQLRLALSSNGSSRSQRAPGTLNKSTDVVRMEVKRDFDINPYAYALNTSRTLDPQEFYRRNYAPFNISHELQHNYMDLNFGDVRFQGELRWSPFSGIDLKALGAIRYQQTQQQHHVRDQSNQAEAYRSMPTTYIRDRNPFLYTDRDQLFPVPQIVLPSGGILSQTNISMVNDLFRLSAVFSKTLRQRHQLYTFLGGEAESVDRGANWFRGWGMQYELGELPFTDYYVFKRGQEENTNYFSMNTSRSRQVAFYGTTSYTYDNRYTVNGTLRYEGTNRLGRTLSARWMPTWNISGLWNLHEESFFRRWALPIDGAAFRASYSLTADRGPSSVTNSKVIINSFNPWRPSTADRESGLLISSLENEQLTFEKKYEVNLGSSLSFGRQRFTADVDYYRRRNKDLIGLINTQGIGGEIMKFGNVAAMASQGVELALGATLLRRPSFSWSSQLNFARATNTVTDFMSRSRVVDLISGNGFAQEGYPVRALFSIPFVRISESGLPVFRYIDGEETTTGVYFQQRDQVDFLHYQGPTDPTTMGGFSNIFTFKNFRMELFLTYSLGNAIRLDPVYRTYYTDLNATTREFWDSWTRPGEEALTTVPVILDTRLLRNNNQYEYAYNAYNYSTVNAAQGDFVRLKNISLQYQVPAAWLQRWGMSAFSLRVNAINPWLIYADKRLNGQDPEFVNAGGVALPIARQYTLTINMGF